MLWWDRVFFSSPPENEYFIASQKAMRRCKKRDTLEDASWPVLFCRAWFRSTNIHVRWMVLVLQSASYRAFPSYWNVRVSMSLAQEHIPCPHSVEHRELSNAKHKSEA